MTTALQSPGIYTDIHGLQSLKREADKQTPEALRAVSQQFEALFVQQMLKSMRDAQLADGLFDSDASKFYLELYDKQIALSMTQGRGIGISDLIYGQLKQTVKQVEQLQSSETLPDNETPDKTFVLPNFHSLTPLKSNSTAEDNKNSDKTTYFDLPQHQLNQAVKSQQNPLAQHLPTSQGQSETTEFNTPKEFVLKLWPSAKKAADELGVKPQVLLAQAALETGWGSQIGRQEHGKNSFNLFNIKAGTQWQGPQVKRDTLEFKDGQMQSEKAGFRVYQSYDESFDDYVSLLKNNPRYLSVLNKVGDEGEYAQALQTAGYATDPDYAQKIVKIMAGRPMENALAQLKVSLKQPIPNTGESK